MAVLFFLVGLLNRAGGWPGITIDQTAGHATNDGGGIVLSKLSPVRKGRWRRRTIFGRTQPASVKPPQILDVCLHPRRRADDLIRSFTAYGAPDLNHRLSDYNVLRHRG